MVNSRVTAAFVPVFVERRDAAVFVLAFGEQSRRSGLCSGVWWTVETQRSLFWRLLTSRDAAVFCSGVWWTLETAVFVLAFGEQSRHSGLCSGVWWTVETQRTLFQRLVKSRYSELCFGVWWTVETQRSLFWRLVNSRDTAVFVLAFGEQSRHSGRDTVPARLYNNVTDLSCLTIVHSQ